MTEAANWKTFDKTLFFYSILTGDGRWETGKDIQNISVYPYYTIHIFVCGPFVESHFISNI